MKLQRGVIILPSAFTLGNLFFGMCAVVSATRGQFMTAAWFIVWAAMFDTLDGRVARFTQTGSRFGEELDSLVDAISFGVAPALIMYQLFLADGTWGWTPAFFYVYGGGGPAGALQRRAGRSRQSWSSTGCPRLTAGMMLATFYPFSQTDFFRTYLSQWRWPRSWRWTHGRARRADGEPRALPGRAEDRLPYTARHADLRCSLMACMAAAITVPAIFFFPATIGVRRLRSC